MAFTIDRESTQGAVAGSRLSVAGAKSGESPTTDYRQPATAEWLALAAIVLLGGISGIAYYLGFVVPYRLEEYYNEPLQDLAKISGHTAPAANEWALAWIVLFACYYLAFRICPPSANVSRVFRRIGLFLICGWAAFFSINLLFMYPVGAADIFDQIFRARLLAHYNLNPFTTLPNNIVGDPLQRFVAWRGDPSPYGPMWEVLAAGVSKVAGDSLWRNLILFKLLVMVAYGINIALTYGILRVIKPDWVLRGTLFFAWNPLVIFEVAGNGHNDSIMVTFLLAAVYLLVLARRSLVIPALMAGALTKFVPALLIPLAAAAIWRDRSVVGSRWSVVGKPQTDHRLPTTSNFGAFSALAIGGVLALGLALVLYAPFWTGIQSVGALGRQRLFTASLPKVALDVLVYDMNMSSGAAQDLVRNGALGLIGIVVVALSLHIFLRGNARSYEGRQALVAGTLGGFYEVTFVYLAFATLWFQPWYLMWLVALTAPVGLYTNANRTVLFCIGGIANYFVWDFIWLWNRSDIRDIQITSAIAIYTLPLLYTLYVLVRNQKSEVRNQILLTSDF